MPLTLVVSPEHPEPRKIDQAARALDDGKVAFYPTDTVYALGCALDARRAVDRIYRLKQMEANRPLAMLCRDVREAATYAVVSDFAYRQIRRLTPGPYTFVLPATREVPRVLLDKRRAVGIRIPDNKICQALVEALGRPLLTSSAIPPGADLACLDVGEAKEIWGEQIDLYIDGDVTAGKPSTVVSLVDDEIQILRAGLGADELV